MFLVRGLRPRNYIGMAVTTLVQYPAQIWAELANPADQQSATIARFSQYFSVPNKRAAKPYCFLTIFLPTRPY